MKPWILLLPIVILQGCLNLNPKVQPVHFYALEATAEGDPKAPLKPTCAGIIGILPVQIPTYLKSNKLLLELNPPEIRYEEYHRWSEPLGEGFGRIIAENLRTLFPEGRFLNAPWREKTPQFTLSVTLQDFHMSHVNALQASAQISLLDGGKIVKTQMSSFEIHLASSSPSSYVEALSELGESISEEVAKLLL